MNKLTKFFQPLAVIPKDALIKNQNVTSNSQKLMVELGLIKSTANGSYHIMPLLQRSIEKCIHIIDENLEKANCQKMTMPLLTSSELWKKTGRYTGTETEILTTKDRHGKVQILSPTHEESITSLLASISPSSYKSFPLRLYQIGVKFRDELKPRFGLIRGREFLMKDLYTFDVTRDDALKTYNEINEAYESIFKTIGVPFVKVKADTGIMGGSESHEFHYLAHIGEDNLVICKTCNAASNSEVQRTENCEQCNGEKLEKRLGIEIGHTFLLEEKYSKVLNATALMPNNKTIPLVMGCYGIGVTRIIPAALEVLSSETELRWPYRLCPFKLIIIPPKIGSKEEVEACEWLDTIYRASKEVLGNDVLIDSRTNLTIGKRIFDAKRMGYPMIMVLGAKIKGDDPKFELLHLNENREMVLSFNELIDEIKRIDQT